MIYLSKTYSCVPMSAILPSPEELDILGTLSFDVHDAVETGDFDAVRDALNRLASCEIFAGNDRVLDAAPDSFTEAMKWAAHNCLESWGSPIATIALDLIAAISAVKGEYFGLWIDENMCMVERSIHAIIEERSSDPAVWALIANSCLHSTQVIGIVMQIIPPDFVVSRGSEADAEGAIFLMECLCRKVGEGDVESVISTVIQLIRAHYIDATLAERLFNGIRALSKRHVVTKTLFDCGFDDLCMCLEPGNGFKGSLPCVCYMLQLHGEAIQDDIECAWVEWGLLEFAFDIFDDRHQKTVLWIMWVYLEFREVPDINLELLRRLMQLVSSPYCDHRTIKLVLLIYSKTVTHFPRPECVTDEFIDRACDILALDDGDFELIGTVAAAMTRCFEWIEKSKICDSSIIGNLTDVMSRIGNDDNRVFIEELMYVLNTYQGS